MSGTDQLLIESIEHLPGVLVAHGFSRLFVVLDETAYVASGVRYSLEPFLSSLSVTNFTEFQLNPKLEDVERGIAQYNEFQPDAILAVGGGTAIDLGKLIGALANEPHHARNVAIGKSPVKRTTIPIVAIPTTAGTGSEATHFAVVYIDGNKYSIAHPSLLPTIAVVDPTLTVSLPPGITAATGLDAFCQAIESIWAVAANEESITYALEAVQLAIANLATATLAPTLESRQAMCRASHLAGKAINITKTTAPHALSYYLTSRYGVPHGMAVAITLAPFLAFNADVTDEDCTDPRGAIAVRARIAQILAAFSVDNIDDACQKIARLSSTVGCPTLSETGAGDDLPAIVDSVNVERLSNNPRRATRDQLIDLLSQQLASTHSF